MKRAPVFWYQRPPTLAARLLSPLGAAYARATARRLAGGARARVGGLTYLIGLADQWDIPSGTTLRWLIGVIVRSLSFNCS